MRGRMRDERCDQDDRDKKSRRGLRTLTIEQVSQHIAALEPRERVIDQLAIFVGMRPERFLGFKNSRLPAGVDGVLWSETCRVVVRVGESGQADVAG